MQTLTLDIQDSFMQDFQDFIEKYKDKVTIKKDKNIALDPYFYERQEKLHNARNEIKSGTAKMLSEKEYEKEMEVFFNNLENA
ncbi:MAG: hypothetical protein U9R42_11725 [Bacteroidota bacterium]|nr:hypothetical protein [Bacteroidota bacterium]